MPPEPGERSLYEEILSSLRVPVRSVSTSHLRPIVRDMLRYVGVRMLVVDEVHAMLASTYRKQRILLNTLRFLATDLRISLVCAGTHDAKRAESAQQCTRWSRDACLASILEALRHYDTYF